MEATWIRRPTIPAFGVLYLHIAAIQPGQRLCAISDVVHLSGIAICGGRRYSRCGGTLRCRICSSAYFASRPVDDDYDRGPVGLSVVAGSSRVQESLVLKFYGQ